jgi:hypothetical protein
MPGPVPPALPAATPVAARPVPLRPLPDSDPQFARALPARLLREVLVRRCLRAAPFAGMASAIGTVVLTGHAAHVETLGACCATAARRIR